MTGPAVQIKSSLQVTVVSIARLLLLSARAAADILASGDFEAVMRVFKEIPGRCVPDALLDAAFAIRCVAERICPTDSRLLSACRNTLYFRPSTMQAKESRHCSSRGDKSLDFSTLVTCPYVNQVETCNLATFMLSIPFVIEIENVQHNMRVCCICPRERHYRVSDIVQSRSLVAQT